MVNQRDRIVRLELESIEEQLNKKLSRKVRNGLLDQKVKLLNSARFRIHCPMSNDMCMIICECYVKAEHIGDDVYAGYCNCYSLKGGNDDVTI